MLKLNQLDPKLRDRILNQIKNEDNSRRKISNPITEHNQAPALGGSAKRKEKSLGRMRVSFRGYRVRPLDPDNFAGSVKDCLDYLRHCGLIPGDEPWRITLETDQVKVDHFREEKLVIEIYDPS